MINEDVKILIPEDFEDNMKIITTIFSSTKEVGLVIAGEDMYPTSEHPILRIYLLEHIDLGWAIQEELHAFAFLNYDAARLFLEKLPNMSALELLIMMSAHEDSREPHAGFLS
ncbi:hypothetical protein [Paenisporosarcina sp. OV554]|uniref:hypothetical protein n=1 Tax=Paenisporosarcina sp. OV554 TaxID=2135694 RepID=UPI000D37D554|nr:hypothetical protein [Paenisporosarcina sp. OV554]PUB08348.1 hypothetical protein C8K15_1342 [Paenisporosarcina sp. OV554]